MTPISPAGLPQRIRCQTATRYRLQSLSPEPAGRFNVQPQPIRRREGVREAAGTIGTGTLRVIRRQGGVVTLLNTRCPFEPLNKIIRLFEPDSG